MVGEVEGLSRRRFMLAASAAALTGRTAAGAVEAWRPTTTVRIFVPSTPGGISDSLARLVAEHLQNLWGASVIVINKPGGGGRIGAMEMLRAAPDGHALVTTSPGPQATAYSLFANLPYDENAFTPISGVIQMPNVLALHPSVPAKTVPELVAYMKANPDKLNYGGPIGSTLHLSALWFDQLTGSKATFVSFTGSAQTALALESGQIQMMFDNLFSQMQNIKAGKISGLAVTTRDPSPLMPELPPIRTTMPELADYEVTTWIGLAMSAKAPPRAALAYNEAMRDMLANPTTIERLKSFGGLPNYMTLDEAKKAERDEIAKWRTVIDKEGIKLNAD